MAATAASPKVIKADAADKPSSFEAKADAALLTDMAAHFAAQPKVTIRCATDQWVQINGYTFIIQGGVKVAVPEQVAELLEESGRI